MMSKQKTQCSSSSSSSLTKLHIKLPSSTLSSPTSTSSFSPSTTSESTLLSSNRKRLLRLDDINTQLTCVICNGYFVDATTIIECLHSFCRSCIVKHLKTSKSCPICDSEVPIISEQYIREDQTLQDIVYKLIPSVYKRERQRRFEFCKNHPEALNLYSSYKERTEFTLDHSVYYQPQDKISLSLEYGFGDNQIPDNQPNSDSNPTFTSKSNNSTCKSNSTFTSKSNSASNSTSTNHSNNQVNEKLQSEFDTKKRYLLCPAGLSIYHLKKFISTKYALPSTFQVDIMYFKDNLNDEFTLIDVAYIYKWRRSEPMRLFYKIREREKPIKKKLKVSHQSNVSNNNSNKSNKSNNNKEKESKSCKSKLSCANQEEENQICSSSTMRCTSLRSSFNSPTTTRSSFNSPTTTRSSFNSPTTTRSSFNSPTTTKSNVNSPTTTRSSSIQNSNKKVKTTTAKTCEKSKKSVSPATNDISSTSLSSAKLLKSTSVSSANVFTASTNATSTTNTNAPSTTAPTSTQHPRAPTSRSKTSASQSALSEASSLAVSTVSEPDPLPLPAPLSPASTASTPSPKPLVISDTFDRSIDIKSNNVTDSHSSPTSSSANSPITIEKPEEPAVVSSSNLSINIFNIENNDFKTTLPTPPSTLPSPSGISIPSFKKEEVTASSTSSSASSTSSSASNSTSSSTCSSSLFNAPLDLSTHKKDNLANSNNGNSSITPSLNAIYDIQCSKPKQCLNPAVLDKHRGLFPLSNAPNKQHPSFKILPTNSRQTNPSLQSPSSSSSTLNNLIENLKKQKESSLNQSMQSQNTKNAKKESPIVTSSINNTGNSHSHSHSSSSLLSIKKQDNKPTNSVHHSPQSPPLCLSLTNLIATKKQQEKSAVISSSIVNSNHISLNSEITSKKNHRPTTTAIIEPAMITSSSTNHKSTSISSNKKQEKSPTNSCYSIVNSNHHIKNFPPNTLIPIEKIKISPVVSSSINSGKSNGNYNSQSSSSTSSCLNSLKKSPEKSTQSMVKANSIKSSSSNHHHHHHHSNHTKTYSVITTDPHSYAPKIVIRNIGSPPLMSSHLQHHHH